MSMWSGLTDAEMDAELDRAEADEHDLDNKS